MLYIYIFDLKFYYILLEKIIYNLNFQISLKKYYLTNIAYYNIHDVLFSYYNIFYHQKKTICIWFKTNKKKTVL